MLSQSVTGDVVVFGSLLAVHVGYFVANVVVVSFENDFFFSFLVFTLS